jgi:tetratricopeptide (TPR) repeat protein
MKWTLIPLLGSALIVYALIFLAQSTRDTQQTKPALASATALKGEATEAATASTPAAQSASEEFEAAAQAANPPGGTVPEEDAQGALNEDDQNAWAKGCGLYEQKDFAAARDALERAVRAQEDRAGRHYLLGLCYLKLQESDLAVSELERAVELKPEAVRYQVNLARAYLAAKEPRTAREVVDSALDTNLEYADAWEVLGRIELQQGNREEAAAAFTKAVQLDPQHAWAWNNLAYLRILQERFEEAEDPLRTAVRLRPEIASFQNNLGVVEERLGHLEDAVASYEQALALGHATAGESAQRVKAVVAYQELHREKPQDETRVASAPADSLVGW